MRHTDTLDCSYGILKLSQKSYIKTVLKRYSIQDCKLGDTLIAEGEKFNLNQCPKSDFEGKKCKKIPCAPAVGVYLNCTQLDIACVIGMLGKYLINL